MSKKLAVPHKHVFDENGLCFECDHIQTPSEYCKGKGLKSLQQVIDITGKPRQTLRDWHKNEPKLFKVVVTGCLYLAEDTR